MPRIDPLELLECLEVILTPSGGIKCEEEVARISSLMERFCKKLVSKAVYLLILKATDKQLLDSFMEYGGWNVIHSWLAQGLEDKNWPLLKEILEVLLICPINVDRLKSNALPRHIKYLSKAPIIPEDIRDLATNIVQDWLIVVKTATQSEESGLQSVSNVYNKEGTFNATGCSVPNDLKSDDQKTSDADRKGNESDKNKKGKKHVTDANETAESINKKRIKRAEKDLWVANTSSKLQKLMSKSDVTKKLSSARQKDEVNIGLADGRNVAKEKADIVNKDQPPMKRKSSLTTSSKQEEESRSTASRKEKNATDKGTAPKTVERLKDIKLNSSRTNKKSELEWKDGNASKHKTALTPASKKSESAAKTASENKDELKSSGEDNKGKHGGEQVSSNKKSSENLEKIRKLKIDEKVKKVDPVPKKPISISIEKRFSNVEEKPKTVKMFNSKFRLTGLEEAMASPPAAKLAPRKSTPPSATTEKKKMTAEATGEKTPKSPSPVLPTSPSLASDTNNNADKDDSSYGKGLSPASLLKPAKKPVIQESGSFIDAMVSAAQVTKDHVRKRKKLPKGGTSSDDSAEKSVESDQFINAAPKLRFYKDTMESSSSDEEVGAAQKSGTTQPEVGKTVTEPEVTTNQSKTIVESEKPAESVNKSGKGILRIVSGLIAKVNVKKTVRWKSDKDLLSIQYFEVDASERSNVSKNFWDMQAKERCSEREALFKARQQLEDSNWPGLIPIDLEPSVVVPGSNSTEKETQRQREKVVPEAIYLTRDVIPDSAMEPDKEICPTTNPPIIPSEDVTGSTDSVNDFCDFKWPDPKMNNPDVDTGPPAVATTPNPSIVNAAVAEFPSATIPAAIYGQYSASAGFPQDPTLTTMPPYGPQNAAVPISSSWPTNPAAAIPQPPGIGIPPHQMVPMCPTMTPYIMGVPGAPPQFIHPNPFMNTNMYMPNMTAAPPTTTVLSDTSNVTPTESNVTSSSQNSTGEVQNNSNNSYSGSGSSWSSANNSNTHNRRGRGAFNDRGGGYGNRGGYGRGGMRSERGGHMDMNKGGGPPDNSGNRMDNELAPNDRFYPREQNWKNMSGNERGGNTSSNWRGAGPPNTRLCRYIKQKGFCSINGCRFFHPRK